MPSLPSLVVTNPVWLKLFHLGLEDPNWGKRTIDQHAIAQTLYEVATLLTDEKVRREIQAASLTHMRANCDQMLKEFEGPK